MNQKLLQTPAVTDAVRIAVALRAARTAIGWNQQEFADKVGVAKSSIARFETLEIEPKGSFLVNAMRVFKEAGVTLAIFEDENVNLAIHPAALNEAGRRLADEVMRRSDRDTKRRMTVAYTRRLLGDTTAEEASREFAAVGQPGPKPTKI